MQHIHIIGIGGTFMGGLARIAKEAGFKVTGCDAKMYPPMSTQLEELGVTVHEGFDAAQLDEFQADMYVIGNVAKRGMDVIEAILNKNLPYTSGPQWLFENVLHKMWVLGVAGTHGKSTTASMLAWVLEYAGYGAGFLIGGVPQNFSVSARLPQNDSAFFVIEADEYDTAFFDKRSKFVHYHPRTAILNNLEYDHADIFPDLNAIQTQFHHLVRTVPSEGLIVANGCAQSIHETIERGCWTPIEWFGSQNGWQTKIQSDNSFDVFFQAACEALSQFKNVKRRMEIKGVANGVTVYDDFAHHPTAIATTIDGLRQKVGTARIVAVLEPRSNTMKLGTMKDALSGSLKNADAVFCYAGGVDWNVADALAPFGGKLHIGLQFDDFLDELAKFVQNGDHVLVMSNGGFGSIHEKLLEKLK